MADLLKFSIPAKPEYVSVVRLAVSSIANRAGFDIEAIEDIKVAVAEACTNAILHGIGENDNICSYEIECCVDDNHLAIVIKDCGEGYNTDCYKNPDICNPKEGGLGIFIIKSLMDDVEIFSDTGKGTTIKMIKYI